MLSVAENNNSGDQVDIGGDERRVLYSPERCRRGDYVEFFEWVVLPSDLPHPARMSFVVFFVEKSLPLQPCCRLCVHPRQVTPRNSTPWKESLYGDVLTANSGGASDSLVVAQQSEWVA